MALTECNTTVGSDGRELLEHGTTAFPIACYEDDFRITDVPWHWHEEWEAVLVTQGNCLVVAGNLKANLQAGDGFFVHSGALHGCWDVNHSGCRFHSMVFHPRLVGGSLDSIFHQQLGSLLNAVMLQILYGCGTDGGTEAPQTFAFTDRCTGGNGSGAELASVLAVDTGKHGFHPLCIPETLLTDGRSGRGQVAVQKPDKF